MGSLIYSRKKVTKTRSEKRAQKMSEHKKVQKRCPIKENEAAALHA